MEPTPDPELDDPYTVGPVRLPEHETRLAAVRAAGLKDTPEGEPFAELPEIEAFERTVHAAVIEGLSSTRLGADPELAPLAELLDRGIGRPLAELLRASAAGEDGVSVDEILDVMTEIAKENLPELIAAHPRALVSGVLYQLGRLSELGVIRLAPGRGAGVVSLTDAGVMIAVHLARGVGIRVLVRPDPAQAQVGELVDLVGMLTPQEWTADAVAWFGARGSTAEAAAELAAEVTAGPREPSTAMAGLHQLDTILGDEAIPAVRAQLGGPHDGLVVSWLVERQVLQPDEVEPERLLGGVVTGLGIALDLGGPDAMVAYFSADMSVPAQLQFLEAVWPLRHPWLLEVLGAIAGHHPDPAIAQAAEKAIRQHHDGLDAAT